MTFRNVVVVASQALFALALSLSAATAKQRHNFVVLVPEAMQAANVNESTTPGLARLRGEGVYFINSYAGFPDLLSRPRGSARPEDPAGGLIVGASGAYETALVDCRRPDTGKLLDDMLVRSKQANRLFLIVCRIRGIGSGLYAPPRSLQSATPGTDGAAGAILYSTDNVLTTIEARLRDLGLYEMTNIIVAAEQGRSTIWKRSRTSQAARMAFEDVPAGSLPRGFLAIDLMKALLVEDGGLSLFDAHIENERLDWWAGNPPVRGSAIVGVTASSPYLTVEARGGYDLIFLPVHLRKEELVRRARSVVAMLEEHDYVSGVFVNERRVGRIDGALSLRHLRGDERAATGVPDIVVSFVSAAQGCGHPTICTIAIADTAIPEGNDLAQGLSRAETSNFIAARGPDFQGKHISRVPASTQDVMRTIGELMGLRTSEGGALKKGRLLMESLRGGELVQEIKVRTRVIASTPSESGYTTEVHLQTVGGVDYLIAAGSPGRSVGVPERPDKIAGRWEWPRWKRFSITISPD